MAVKTAEQMRAYGEERERKKKLVRDSGDNRFCMSTQEVSAWVFISNVSLTADRGRMVDYDRKRPIHHAGLRQWMPDSPGIYFISVVDDRGVCKPLYIGMSYSSVRGRVISGHEVLRKIMDDERASDSPRSICINYLLPPLDLITLSVEAAAIARWMPPLNAEVLFPDTDMIEAYLKEMKEILGDYSFF